MKTEVMPPPKSKRKLSPAQVDAAEDAGSTRGRSGASTGRFEAPRRPPLPARQARRLARNGIDRLRPRPARTRRPGAVAGGAARDADPPRLARPDRPAADAGRGRCVPRRHGAGRLREGGRSRCSPRRATASAWPGTGSTPLATPTRNGYQGDADRTMWPWRDWVVDGVQRQHAVRPVHDRAARRRPAARTPRREQKLATGVLPQSHDQRRRRPDRRGEPRRLRHGHGRDRRGPSGSA